MWKPLDDYCWTNGEYNICKVGTANGMKYELWHAKKRLQLAVNLPNSKAALAEWRRLTASLESSPTAREAAV